MKTNRVWRKIYHNGPMIFGMLLLAVIMLIWSLPSNVRAEGATSAASNQANAPCKGLKPYNNLDELLYQFYINLESDCLFKMSTAELEEIWGIKILDDERAKPKNYYPLSETEFYNKPYKTERGAFYVELTRLHKTPALGRRDPEVTFTLKSTKDYYKKYGSLLPSGNLPSVLPKPDYYISAELKIDSQPCVFPAYAKRLEARHDAPTYCVFPLWRFYNDRHTIAITDSNQIKIKAYLGPDELKHRDDANRSDWPQAATEPPVEAVAETIPCRGLKPPENLDDLLYQFYINLDSDCLFKMSPSELEKIWNIKIASTERVRKIASAERAEKEASFSALVRGSEFRGKPYELDKDAFYVKMWEKDGSNSFGIEMTDAYKDKRGSFFPGEKFPKLLPDPIIGLIMPPLHGPNIDWCYQYYWENSAKTQAIKLSGDQKFTTVTIGPSSIRGGICPPH